MLRRHEDGERSIEHHTDQQSVVIRTRPIDAGGVKMVLWQNGLTTRAAEVEMTREMAEAMYDDLGLWLAQWRPK